MSRERTIPFFLLVGCLVAATSLSAGASSLVNSGPAEPARLAAGLTKVVITTVTLCHLPPENPSNAQTIVVGQAAVAAHLAHGDYLGECRPACSRVPAPLPKTGQTACYDLHSNAISCRGSGQDGEYQAGTSVDPRFTDNGDGTVNDNLTGLIWLKNADCLGSHLWADALIVANTLATGACGLTDGSAAGDWRLPNVRELQSLIDVSQFNPALPPGHPFSGVHAANYWSSTTSAYGAQLRPMWGNAWFVDVNFGDARSFIPGADGDKQYAFSVWPVRGGR